MWISFSIILAKKEAAEVSRVIFYFIFLFCLFIYSIILLLYKGQIIVEDIVSCNLFLLLLGPGRFQVYMIGCQKSTEVAGSVK